MQEDAGLAAIRVKSAVGLGGRSFGNRLYLVSSAILICFTAMVFLAGCGDSKSGDEVSQAQQKVINFGKFEAGVYTNDFFNLKVGIPPSWSVMGDDDRNAMMQKAGNFIAGDDENLKKHLDAADLKNLVLFVASEQPVGAQVEFNPNFDIAAQSLAGLPGIKTGSDIHFQTKQLLKNSNVVASYPTDIYQQVVGGISFDVLDIKMTVGKKTLMQKQYATVRQGYGLVFALSYQTPQDLQKLESILANTSFS